MNTLTRRPTETTSGLALLVTVYGFLTQAGLPNGIAAVIAAVAAFAPAAVTALTDALFLRRGSPLEESAGESVGPAEGGGV